MTTQPNEDKYAVIWNQKVSTESQNYIGSVTEVGLVRSMEYRFETLKDAEDYISEFYGEGRIIKVYEH